MPGTSRKTSEMSNLEAELYLLIAKFLNTGVCKEAAEVLRKEIEIHQLLPKRIDWHGEKHSRSFSEIENTLGQISDDHLLKICSRIGPILDKEIPPTVHGLQSLLGVGRQSLLRTKEDEKKVKISSEYLTARQHGSPFYPSPAIQNAYPPNVTKVLLARESSGPVTSRHVFSTKIHARMQNFRRILGHLSSVYCVLFDRTGKYIFTGADDLLVKIWSAVDGRLLASFRGHSAEITDMTVNFENTLLAAGSCDKTIRVWSLFTTGPVAVLSGHTAMVTSLQFCPYQKGETRYLVSTGNDGCVCFWEWSSTNNSFKSKPLKFTERNKAGAQMICSSFSTGGVFLATGSTDHNVRVYNIAGTTGPEKILEKEAHSDRVDSIQFSNLDCRFISGSKDGTAMIWKYERQSWHCMTLKMSTKLPGSQPEENEDTKLKLRVTMVGWTLDDSQVITAVSDHNVKVWNSRNGTLCHVLKGHEDDVFILEAHPIDVRVLLTGGHDGRIMLWDLVTGSLIKSHFNLIEGQGHGAVFDCKFSPDGQMFAATDSHGHLSIYGLGSNDRYKKVPEEQFFHTDYRPLIRDLNHHVLDEQTQTPPHLLPPPFLVDIDGNPYPPNLQRLVPGRENCNESQLVPYVAVSAEGEAEILEPVRPADNNNRRTIDDMIERLQQEREQGSSPPHHQPPENDSDSSDEDFSSRSGHRLRSGERNVSDPFSPRSAQRAQAGLVAMRRTGDIEGVRQSVANWQTRGVQSDVPSWVRRVIVKRMNPSLAAARHERQVRLAESELTFFEFEKKRSLPDSFPTSSRKSLKQDERSLRRLNRQQQQRLGLRSSRLAALSNPNANSSPAEEENGNFSSSTETENEPKENWEDSSGESSGSGEYSDWTADAGLNVEKKKLRGHKPSNLGTSTRPRRHVSSDEDDSDEEGENDSSRNSQEPSTSKAKDSEKVVKKREVPSRNKKKVIGKKLPERYRPPEWLTDVNPHKAPYVPQIGDEVVYFRHGHELYVQAVKRARIYDISMRSQPWRHINLRDQEVAKIVDMSFENHPPRLVCLTLELRYPHDNEVDKIVVKYHDMADVIDFIVLKQNYDQAMCYNWKPGNRFRSAIDKAWWLGTIKGQKPFNENYPDSMFQCFFVKWDNGEKEHMSPWDLEPIDVERLPDEVGGSVRITPEESLAMMYVPDKQEWSPFGQEYDIERLARGLARIMELSIAEPFTTPVDLNRYPTYAIVVEYPMDLGTIRARLQNRFYRRLEAAKFDLHYIELNATVFNVPGSPIVKQAKCVVELCIRFFDSSDCQDPMILYHEMMEAKQSRSQDSQSELDVLCSESDSNQDHPSSGRMKRRRRRERILQSNKRLKMESLKYTSKSWKSQCSALWGEMYQREDSTPFRNPVDLNVYRDYRDIIDVPMDLSTVKDKLETNQYYSPVDLCKDMRLVFQNSKNYNTNKKSRIYSMTIRLSAFFEEKIRSIVSDWKSAVKYEEKLMNNQYVSNRRKPFSAGDSDCLATNQRRDDTNKPGPSRVAQSSRHEEASVNRRLRGGRDGGRISPKSSSIAQRREHRQMRHGNSLTNGALKRSRAESLRESKLRSLRRRRTEPLSDRRIDEDEEDEDEDNNNEEEDDDEEEDNDDDEENNEDDGNDEDEGNDEEDEDNEEEENKDSEASSNCDEYDDDDSDHKSRRKSQRRKHNSNTPPHRLRPRQQKMRNGPVRVSQRNLYRQHNQSSSSTTTTSEESRIPTRASAPAAINSRPSTTVNNAAALKTRSMTVLQPNSGTRMFSRSGREIRQRHLSGMTGSDGSDTEESRNSTGSSNARRSSNTNSHSEEAEFHKNEQRSKRLTRSTSTKTTKAASSALHDHAPMVRKRKLAGNIQTRSRGQRTVRYEEDSDELFYNDSDNDSPDKVSISSRGRLRKLTRHGKALFSE